MLTGTAIQLTSTFDSSSLAEPLAAALQSCGLSLQVRVTPPDRLQEHMLTPSGDSEDTIGTVVLVRLEDWLRSSVASGQNLTDAIIREQLRTHIDEFVRHLAVLALRGRPVWLMVCPSTGWVAEQAKAATLCRTMTNLFAVRVKNSSHVDVLPFPAALAVDSTLDREADRAGHNPFAMAGSQDLARDLANLLAKSIAAKDPNAAAAPSGSPELAAFLTGLHVAVKVRPATDSDLADFGRILRTAASFSLAGENPTMSDLDAAKILAAGGCYMISVTDRLSDYGPSGVFVARPDGNALVVNSASLSCTVLGKQVEYALLDAASRIASQHGLSRVVFDFQPSQRNQSTSTFLRTALDPESENRYALDVKDLGAHIRKSAIAPGGWTVDIL
jgi:hypothetical protein